MQSIIDKFSLQNLLRQFFCGFVFIASFWFFASGNTTEDLTWPNLKGFLNGTHWDLSGWIILAVAASIIGTIIYHLEKNLYSYSIQALFEGIEGRRCACKLCKSRKSRKSCWSCWLCKVIAPILVFILPLCGLVCSAFWPYIVLLIVLFIDVLSFVCPCMFSQVIERTQKIWIIETGTEKCLEDDNKNNLKLASDRKAIAQKLATWSDFIHCTQSCCFAWIAGYWVTKCWIAKCGLADVFCAACKEPSVQVAISILLLELLFDWHRYQHVLAITKPQASFLANK